ncbi:MAG: hypothetical protein ACE1ZO_00670, partial [Nitrospirales bacterium]
MSTAKWRPACAKATAGRERRWLVCRSLGEGWRLFSTFPYNKTFQSEINRRLKRDMRKEWENLDSRLRMSGMTAFDWGGN